MPSKAGNKNFIGELFWYVQFAFNHESTFLEKFWCNLPENWEKPEQCELSEFYMASERTRITVINSAGHHIDTTIKTQEYIDWADNQ